MNLYGINPVTEALESGKARLEKVYITRGKAGPRLQKIIDLARSRGVPLHFEPGEVLTRKAGTPKHQDVVADTGEIRYIDLERLLQRRPSLLLALDGVEDPHNLGAVLRTAEAAGVDGILLPQRRTSPVTPVVVKTSAGAALHLPICRVGNLVQALERLKQEGFWVVGLDMKGNTRVADIDPGLPLAVVVGGEHQGVRRLVAKNCDFLVSLPMKGRVASLNLSVAAGVLLYQLLMNRG
jgi:23S rRNA (guanosine2251-2'-O)-methyltransferase